MLIALVRTVILYLFIVLGIRLLGKRQIGELEPSELVLSLIIADLATIPMEDYGTPLLAGLIPILTLLALSSILSMLTVKSIRLRSLLCGQPSIIIKDGQLLQREMLRNRFTADELMEELRVGGFCDISRIKYAILETSGRLSILPYRAEEAPSCADLGLTVEEGGLPLVLVSDGRLLSCNLEAAGKSEAWLNAELRLRGVQETSEVFLLTLDELGGLYFSRRERAGKTGRGKSKTGGQFT